MGGILERLEPVERCLACEAVVNRALLSFNDLSRAALYRLLIERGGRAARCRVRKIG